VTCSFGVNPDGALVILTREGAMRADVGDWIIKGVQGEFYPCKPDIFAATYEPAETTLGNVMTDEELIQILTAHHACRSPREITAVRACIAAALAEFLHDSWKNLMTQYSREGTLPDPEY